MVRPMEITKRSLYKSRMKIVAISLVFSVCSWISPSALASQGLLHCEGPKASVELWFSGELEPSYIYVYQLDPAFGSAGEHLVWSWSKAERNLRFVLVSKTNNFTRLEFNLHYNSLNQVYSGTLTATDSNGLTVTFPNNSCSFY